MPTKQRATLHLLRRLRCPNCLRVGLIVGVGLALAGCGSGIEAWRSLSGANRNDPGPTAPFTGNIAAAEAAPYPNLASVPPPPSRATTAAERQRLAEKLMAERTSAAPVPALTRPAAGLAAPPAGVPPAAPVTAAANQGAAGASPAIASAAAPGAPAAATEPAARRNAQTLTEPPPMDSSLQMPQVRSLPEPDSPRHAPPPPRLAAVPAPAATPRIPAAALSGAAPQPAPAPPELTPPGLTPPGLTPIAPRPPPDVAAAAPQPLPAATTIVLTDALDRTRIEQAASRYREQQGTLRVLSFTPRPTPGADPLGFYHAALERAQAVAKALTAAGVPADKIRTEASPASGETAAGRIEIHFMP